MSQNPPPPIVVPKDQAARQAIPPLEGYIYQIYQTVLAWQSLGENERLYVELAEDFAHFDAESLELIQIKRAKSTLTLRSKAVPALIGALWSFQESNPGTSVTAVLITTGRIGRERGLTFPDKRPGLEHWRVAAREHADLTPLRSALLALKLPKSLVEFLKAANPEDIRARLLRRIRWIGSAAGQDDIQRDIEERLVHFGDRLQVGAQDSRNALPALALIVLNCVRRTAAERFLTAADFRTAFEKHTHILVPPSMLEGQLARSAVTAESFESPLPIPLAASIPLPPRASLRTPVVEALHTALVELGTLWLHGSSGLGKTTLALLLARRQSVPWLFADLRDLDPVDLRASLEKLNYDFAAARGLILDDLPGDPDNATMLRLRQLQRTLAARDGVLVVTSGRMPSPSLQQGLGLIPEIIRVVPYVGVEDVASMVEQAGGDVALWARVIHAFCGGHPQLVAARIWGLQNRGWPPGERFAELDPKPVQPNDVAQERKSVATRLLRELPSDSMELLVRLSLLTGLLDRPLVQQVADVSPGVARAGLLFDSMVGPWIEQLGAGLFRLSPLLHDSGREGLSQNLQGRIRTGVLEHLIVRRPFPGEQFLQALILAFSLQHHAGLLWIASALMRTHMRDKQTFRRLAQDVSTFAAFDRGERQLLFAPDAHLSCMLRLAQLQVAVATDQPRRAANTLDRLLWEIEQLPERERSRFRAMALGSALVERTIPLTPARWIGMLHTLASTPEIGREFTKPLKPHGSIAGLLRLTYEELLFGWRASALDGIDALANLIETLQAETPENRERYLSAVRNSPYTRNLIVSSAWLAEVRKPGFDARAAVARLGALYPVAAAWTNTDIAVEIGCAEAVLLDEYTHDGKAALDVLAATQSDFPSDYRISRQRQRVHYRAGDHAKALSEFESFASALQEAPALERVWVLREAGRSAALTGDGRKALSFFEGAWEAARSREPPDAMMIAGLSADSAVLAFEAGHIEHALKLMLRALAEAETVDFTAGLRERYCGLILLAAILWMRGEAEDWPAERQAMLIGMCSDPSPKPEFGERRPPPRLLPWYQLAELEADRTESETVLAALRQRAGSTGLLPMEATLNLTRARRAVRTLNVDRFLEVLPLEPRGAQVSKDFRGSYTPDAIYEMPTGHLNPITLDEWADPALQRLATDVVLIFSVAAVCSDRSDVLAELRTRLVEVEGLWQHLKPVFEVLDEPTFANASLSADVASTLGRMLAPGYVFDAASAFAATVYFFRLLRRHELGEAAAAAVVTRFAVIWRDILANRRFSVVAPAVSEPAIVESLSKGGPYVARLAHLILASRAAVRTGLSEDLRATIETAAAPARNAISTGSPLPTS